jgi:ketosteroid isomerase-like protein
MTGLRHIADRYVEVVNRGEYHRLAELFAEDALFLGPGGREARGRAEIDAFYGAFLPTVSPTVRIAEYVEHDHHSVWELEARLGDDAEFQLAAIDHATVDADGLIARFAVFTK